jgi:hypothetical protein
VRRIEVGWGELQDGVGCFGCPSQRFAGGTPIDDGDRLVLCF